MFCNAQTLLQDDWQTLRVQFELPEVQIAQTQVDGIIYNTLTVEGYYPSTQVGTPNLPLFSAMVEVPMCNGYKVTVSDAVYDTIALPDGYIIPVQAPRSKSDTTRRQLALDRKVYATDAFFRSAELATMSHAGIARDRSLARLQFAPLAYNPTTNKLAVCRKATVTVTYDKPDITASLSHFERYHSPMFAAGATTMNALYPKSVSTTAPVRYLIVAHSSFDGQLDEFATWKRRKGFKVDIVYTGSAAVGSTSSSIAAYVKSQYTNATSSNPAPTYLLLVGDHEQIPAFTGSTDYEHITDLDFVKWTTGDNLPDCYTGRFSAQTVVQLTPQIEKTLMYEQYTFADPSFLDRAVMVAGIDDGTSGDYGYTHADPAMDYAVTNYINGSRGFSQVRYYKNNTSIVPSATNVTVLATGSSASSSCRSDYNAGAGWINYSAHGSETSWYLPSMTTSYVSAMTNTQKFGVVIGNCCLTNHFQTGTCLGEAFLRKSNYAGAVAYIGGTNSTYWDEDVYWAMGVRSSISASMSMAYNSSNRGMYDHLCHTHNEAYANWATTLGAMIYVGNMSVQNSGSSLTNYYWEIYELMGDPSLMPYLTQASTMTVSATSTIPVGTTTLSVHAAPYAYVALTDTATHTLMAAAFANASGNATLTIPSSLQVGGYEIAASAQQYKTTFKALQVVPANGPYPQAVEIEATADLVAGSTVPMNIEVTNTGNQSASNVTVTLSCSNQDVTLSPTTITLGQLATDATTTAAFTATIAADAADNTTATITATVSCSQTSSTSQLSSEFMIVAPEIEIESLMQPSSLMPGGEAMLRITITNTGHAPLEAAQITLASASAALTTTAINNVEFSLAAGASETLNFTLQASSTIANGTTVPLYVSLSGQNEPIDTIEVYIGENRDETFENGIYMLEGWSQGDIPWMIVSGTSHGGSYSARSNQQMGNSQTSEISITVNVAQADSISFWYKVSSESNYDKFHFYIDDEEMLVNSGEVSWTRAAYAVSAGNHTFRFSYSKDVSVSSGSDCAWIDDVRIPLSAQTTQSAQQYVLTVTAANGITIGSGSYGEGETATIGVMPSAGYTFTAWSDGNTNNPRQLTVNGNIHLTATLTSSNVSHDTLYITQTDTVTEYVTVHDTTYVNVPYAVHDTTYIDVPYAVHDTTYVDVPYTVHDTTYIDVHDTTYIDVHDTTYIDVHDTIYIDAPYAVHDTTIVVDTVTLTEYVPVHDTTYITLTDTVTNTITDTITNTVFDTVDNYIYDTTIVTDTLWMTEYDTIVLYDTIVIHDTIYITDEGIDGVETINAKVYARNGQIVVDGAEGNTVWLYDVSGRVLATKQDDYTPLQFDVPASGAYLIKIGRYPARRIVVIR